MEIGSIHWFAPRRNRRLLVVILILMALSLSLFPLLGTGHFHGKGVLARSAVPVLALACLVGMFSFLFLLIQVVPGRQGDYYFRAYQILLLILAALHITFTFWEGLAVWPVRALFAYLFWTAVFLPKAIVFWTVPDVPGTWNFGASPPERLPAESRAPSPPADPVP